MMAQKMHCEECGRTTAHTWESYSSSIKVVVFIVFCICLVVGGVTLGLFYLTIVTVNGMVKSSKKECTQCGNTLNFLQGASRPTAALVALMIVLTIGSCSISEELNKKETPAKIDPSSVASTPEVVPVPVVKTETPAPSADFHYPTALAAVPKPSKEVLSDELYIQVCRATIGTIMGRSPSIIAGKIADNIVYLRYIRSDDNSEWTYRCMLTSSNGSQITWASGWGTSEKDTGRWRIHSEDGLLNYTLNDGLLRIIWSHSDGSKTMKEYQL